MSEESDYRDLEVILKRALNQARYGKGKERHANGRPFDKQPIIVIQELIGSGFALGQAVKKIQESKRLDVAMSSIELLGAINYLAAAILFTEREDGREEVDE